MYTVGVDIGSSAAKAVLLKDGKIEAVHIIPTGINSVDTGNILLDCLMEKSNLKRAEITHIIATGYGRINADFADKVITEISCHAKGLHYMLPMTRTILDMGGQDCKVIACNEKGMVDHFLMNDRCAAGTGRYLERISMALDIPIEEIGPRSLDIQEGAVAVSSWCSVFAESDVVLMLRRGKHRNDILAGICDGIVERISRQVEKIGMEEAFAVTGGIAQNIGIVQRLEKKLQVKVYTPELPQYIGALGAALYAWERGKR